MDFRKGWGRLVAAALMFVAGTTAAAQEPTRLLRFPDIHGDEVVFTYAGDLWKAPVTGGTAVRLTSHPGLELFAKFSPDGQWIAFTGQYDGDEQVYVIPASGGEARQLTFHPSEGPLPARWGYDNQVYGWTPDGTKVLFRSLRDSFAVGNTRLYTVPLTGGLAEPLPMPMAGAGAFAPNGTEILYSPLMRDFRTWKRYEGGWAQNLYIFNIKAGTARQVTDHPRTERDPMWIGDRIYFVSDRSDYLNIYEMDPSGGEARALTRHRGADVRWASDDGAGRIVYELDGVLRVLDVRTGEDREIPIVVPDDGTSWRPSMVDASRSLESFDISPDGERLAIVARGELFTVPAEHGITRNLSQTPGAHEREAAWSPDGKWIAYVSDASGEEELYVVPQAGGEAMQLTKGHVTRYLRPVWSPDSEKIAYSDKDGRILVISRKGGKAREVAKDRAAFKRADYAWSPDGRYLAMSLGDPNGFNSLHVWDDEAGKLHRVTSDLFNEWNPVWSADGKYLYYLSDREFAPQVDLFEWNYMNNRQTGIFGLTLRRDTLHQFPPRNNEVNGKDENGDKDSDKADDKGNDREKKRKVEVRIDFEGLGDRSFRVPVPVDNYRYLAATAKELLYVRTDAFYYGRDGAFKPQLMSYDMKERKSKKIADNVTGVAVAADGKSVAVQHDRSFRIYKLGAENKSQAVSLANLKAQRVPREEWRAIFHETWRRFRDHFYVDNMHGYDWEALRDKYAALLPHVGHRSDLNYLMGEMIAELNVSHAYVSGGDEGLPPRPATGVLGATFSLDEDSGRYRIARILPGHNEEPRYVSPLTLPGVNVREGDYLIAINGRDLKAPTNPYALLRGMAEKPVELTVNDKPAYKGARRVIVTARSSNSNLNYLAWVLANRERVEKLGGGRVGYLHVPDMGANGVYEFAKWFYGQARKDGLVIDVRGNGGGNVSEMLIERLGRKLIGLTYARTAEYPLTYPTVVHVGPKVTILNETSASDGDLFPWAFRESGIGPLIGKRSWGGVIGITNRGPLLDGGVVNVPEFGNADARGRWVIEGEGVVPDMVVDNDPAVVAAGRDPQLERAVAEILKALDAAPDVGLPAAEPAPVKTPRIDAGE